jgi:hypothetical protein
MVVADADCAESDADPKEASKSPARVPPQTSNMPTFRTVSWFDQFYWCLWKNLLLLMRRPIMFALVLLSGIIAVVLSWVVGGRDPDESDVIYPPDSAYTECGSVDLEWLDGLEYNSQNKVQLTLNENWRDGVEVAMMGLGALFQAIFVFTVVNGEVHAQLLGVLRALGLRDSVYWISWYIPFFFISFVNALLGAITAKILPGHVYESVYFAGIFSSLFFLNLSLVSASLFLVALCGTGRKLCSNFSILFVILAAFIPLIVLLVSSSIPATYDLSYFYPYPPGLFWENRATSTLNTIGGGWDGENYTYTTELCNTPIMNEEQGKWYKTDQERMEEVEDDEFFVGW